MHILGLQGMIRREYTYPASLGLTFWNEVSTLGAFIIAVVDPGVHRQRGADAMQPPPARDRTTRGTRARSSGRRRARRPSYNFDEIPDGPLARRVLAPQVRRGQERAARARAGGRRGAAEHDAGTRGRRTRSTCRARRTGRSWRRSGCRSWPTASSTRGGWSASARRSRWSGSTDGRSSPRWRSRAMADVAIAEGRTTSTRPRTGLPHTKLAMWLFLVLRVPAVRRADHHVRAVPRRQRQGPVPVRRLRHRLHVGVVVRPAGQLADDGARAGGRAEAGLHADAAVARSRRRCSA